MQTDDPVHSSSKPNELWIIVWNTLYLLIDVCFTWIKIIILLVLSPMTFEGKAFFNICYKPIYPLNVLYNVIDDLPIWNGDLIYSPILIPICCRSRDDESQKSVVALKVCQNIQNILRLWP